MSDTRLSTLIKAMQLETEGMAFYQAAYEKAASKTGRNMFEYLRKSEEGHLKRISTIYHSLVQLEDWPADTAPTAKKRPVLQTIFTQAHEELKSKASLDSGDIEILQQAIKFEQEGSNYYTKCIELATDAFEKTFYVELEQEERRHITALQDTILMLENPQSFFAERERGTMAG